MENLNAEQVKKALECCTSYCDKDNCPYKTHDIPIACMTMRMVDALALINSQEQRIKELAEENNGLQELVRVAVDTQYSMGERIEKLTEENERLRDDCVKGANALIEEMQKNRTIEADTVRELTTRFAMCFGTYTDKDMTPITEAFRRLDQIAKEMLEGEK